MSHAHEKNERKKLRNIICVISITFSELIKAILIKQYQIITNKGQKKYIIIRRMT